MTWSKVCLSQSCACCCPGCNSGLSNLSSQGLQEVGCPLWAVIFIELAINLSLSMLKKCLAKRKENHYSASPGPQERDTDMLFME